MKHLLTPFILLSFVTLAKAQDGPEPTVLFLFPREVAVPGDLKADLEGYDKELEITDEVRKNFIPANLAPNWKTMREKELDFIRKQDFATVLVVALSRELTYKQVQHHPNPLIYPVKTTSRSDKAGYKNLADQHNISWLVNVQKVGVAHNGPKNLLEVSVQLYNVVADRIFLTKTYTAGSDSVKTCEEDIWYCLSENIKEGIAFEIADIIDKNRQYHR